MNGEPLPAEHGFPARLVVAGLYGYVSATKWLDAIQLTTWEDVDGFWIPRGWSKEGPIKTASRIDVPRSGATLDAGPQPIAGVAWAPPGGITARRGADRRRRRVAGGTTRRSGERQHVGAVAGRVGRHSGRAHHPRAGDRRVGDDADERAGSAGPQRGDRVAPPDGARAVTVDAGAVLAWGMPRLRDLPWRATRDPWRILVAEVMLQQTQALRVIPKWTSFCDAYPTPAACAAASLGDVLRHWQGLGYPRRARNLHDAAGLIVSRHGGDVPDTIEALHALPGVGPYTARAVLAFAFERDVAVVDTNIARVLARVVRRAAHAAAGAGGR